MKIRFIGLLISALLLISAGGSDKPAYQIFDTKGKKAKYRDLLKDAGNSQVIFFGELHDNPICHWMEFELMKDLYEIKSDQLVLAAEMFEIDNQLLLNEYTRKFIRKKDFEAEAKLWANYKTDYAPLVDFAREHGLRFVATNIPRRYAAIVNLQGFQGLDSINAYQRGMIAPLPIKFDSNLTCYKSMKTMIQEGGGSTHQSMHLAEAQAIKDATMGWFIYKNLGEGITLLHFNGAYHSDNYEGTVWYLKDFARRFPFDTNILSITCVEQESLDTLSAEHQGKADYIICIPTSMTKTR